MIDAARRLIRLVGETRRLFVIAALLAAAQSAVLAPLALIVRSIFDEAIPRHDSQAIVIAAASMFALFTVSAGLGLLSRSMAIKVVKTSVQRLRGDLVEQVYALPRSWHDHQDGRRLQSSIVNDSERADYLLTQLAAAIVPSALIVVALSVVALVLNPLLFGLLAVVAPLLAVLARALGGRTRELVRVWHDALGAWGAAMQTALRTLNLAKVEGAEKWEVQRQRDAIAGVTAKARALAESQATYGAVQQVIVGFMAAVVLAVGGVAVAEGSLSLGELLSFYAVGALLLRHLALVGPGLSSTIVLLDALERLEALREERVPEPYQGRRQIEFRGEIRVEDVVFAHDAEPTLDGVSFTISRGEHVALLGPNASGKSTMVSLLLGLYRPASGTVFLDGIAMDELDLRHLRRQIGVVLQDAVLFPGTIAENITYGRPATTAEELREAARIATAAEVIERLPHGYDTPVGEEGELLSGGEAQRIAIARALLGRPRLLILDEPTTYMDDASVTTLLEHLAALEGRPTVLIVTHDAEVAATADRLVRLRSGRVIDGPAAAGRSEP